MIFKWISHNNFSQLLLSMMEPLIFTGTGWQGERNEWLLEAFAFKLLKLNHSNIFPVAVSRLFMTSLSVGPHP